MPLSELSIARYLILFFKKKLQITSGMAFVKEWRAMSHGNLCLENIMLTDNLGIKISFFGSPSDHSYNPAAGIRQMTSSACNKWMPSCLSSSTDHPTDADIDISSFGVVMWEIFTLAQLPPYGGSTNRLSH